MVAKAKSTGPIYRLGDLLLRRGLISYEELRHALAVQRAAIEEDDCAPRLGEILVRQRILDRATIREILEEQKVVRGEKRRFQLEISQSRGAVIVRLRGRLDETTDARLVRVLERLLNRGAARIVLDARRLLYINNLAISSLIVFVDETRLRGGDLKIFGLDTDTRVPFERLQLTRYLHVTETESQAVRAFDRPVDDLVASGSLSEFVSTSAGRYYHLSYCPDNRRAPEETRLYFRTKDVAEHAGKSPCDKCRP